MRGQKRFALPPALNLVILLAAAVKFALHLYSDPGYGFFADEFYTIALSDHLAFGYVDLPPLVPALVALSRALLGESLFALHIVPALAGAVTLVFICLIAREFGGRAFAVALSALGFMIVPVWLLLDSIFCYDSIDQMVLAGFLFVLVRFLRTGDRRLWILLGGMAGIACNTKMTILFLGPGFLIALLASKYRRDLLTPWPWLGAALCLALVTPYLLWQASHGWPTLEYWTAYGTLRLYQASLPQYLTNVVYTMNPMLLPVWMLGLYRLFRPFGEARYGFLGILFLVTLAVMFHFHAAARMLAALFIPLLAAGSLLVEELLSGARWKLVLRVAVPVCLAAGGALVIPVSLPLLPADQLPAFVDHVRFLFPTVKEFNGLNVNGSEILTGRLGWEELVQDAARVYRDLPPQDRAVAGVYTDWYPTAGAIDLLGPRYGLPHAVSGSLTYYFWGPGYSWDVMILVSGKTNHMSVFFEECELKAVHQNETNPMMFSEYIFVCRHPKVPADTIWSSARMFR